MHSYIQAPAAAAAAEAAAALASSNQGPGSSGGGGGKDEDENEDVESEDDELAGPDRVRAAREAAVKAAAYGDGVLNEGKFRCVCLSFCAG